MKIENILQFSQRLNLSGKVERSSEQRAPRDDRNECRSTRAAIRHCSSSGVMRAEALPERVEAPAGWRVRHPSICRGARVDPARRARPTLARAYGL